MLSNDETASCAAGDRVDTPEAGSARGTPDSTPVAPKRIAVVVVHGVADQKPGDTAQLFFDLMVASTPNGARYRGLDGENFDLSVSPMPSHVPFSFDCSGAAPKPAAHAHRHLGDASPAGDERSFPKALAQSVKSDFQRPSAHGTEDTDWRWLFARARHHLAHPTRLAAIPDAQKNADRGLQYTSYLLEKAIRNGAPTETFASRKLRLERTDSGGGRREIDVYEMYWADLSRLSGALPRIVTETFTMIFRLSRLARDTVDEASRYAGSNRFQRGRTWAWLSASQTLIDWSFTNILAQLFAQLLLVGLFVAAAALAGSATESAGGIAAFAGSVRLGGTALALVALACASYFVHGVPRWGAVMAAASIAAAGFVVVASPSLMPLVGSALFLILLTTAYVAGLRAADDRFPFIYWSGWLSWLVLLVYIGYRALVVQSAGWDAYTDAGLAGVERILQSIKLWWTVGAVVIATWVGLTATIAVKAFRAHDFASAASAATGRLGLVASMASFLIVAMALWAGLQTPMKLALDGHLYAPVVWTQEANASNPAPAVAVASSLPQVSPSPVTPGFLPKTPATADSLVCDDTASATPRDAARFLDCRFKGSTASFSLVTLLLAIVLVYLLATVLPSVLAELQWASSQKRDEARRLGTWLTRCYRRLDPVLLGLATASACAALAVAALFITGSSSVQMVAFSQSLLNVFVIPAAGAFAGFSAFGKLISRYAPGIRAPLDAVLDVDNFLREFPRRAIPRARIFARYRALLEKIRSEGYEHVVIVSHSQGTVISAEFLRFIASTDVRRHHDDRAGRMLEVLGCKVRLLTLGCPLRQLYAARFPTLYEWVLRHDANEASGPRAGDVGVEVWANAFGSGDYVGRWMWSAPTKHGVAFHPLVDSVSADGAFGRQLAYDAFDPMPPDWGDLRRLREYESCIGFAAHTHYFDPPRASDKRAQSTVALFADDLIAGPRVDTSMSAPPLTAHVAG